MSAAEPVTATQYIHHHITYKTVIEYAMEDAETRAALEPRIRGLLG